MVATNAVERGFTLRRILNAPRDLVFQAWTDPAHLLWFFNPSMPLPSEPIDVDLRVGGAWRVKMVVNENTPVFHWRHLSRDRAGREARLHLGGSGWLARDRPRPPR